LAPENRKRLCREEAQEAQEKPKILSAETEDLLPFGQTRCTSVTSNAVRGLSNDGKTGFLASVEMTNNGGPEIFVPLLRLCGWKKCSLVVR
jgi:hypothetical protein